MTLLKNGKRRLQSAAAAGLMAAVIGVCTLPISASATVVERPPEIPESELINNGTSGQKAIPPEYPGDGAEKPTSSDFDWVNSVTNIFDVPAGATSLRKPSEVKGDWKAFLVGQPTETLSFFGVLNTKIEDKGNGNITFKAKWKTDTIINNSTGEVSTMDSSVLGDTTYVGGMTDQSLYAEDKVSDTILRHMFVNSDLINDFIIVNFYQQGNRQYALGIFETDKQKQIGNIYMTRTVSTSTKKSSGTASSIATEWSGYSGYWVYEYTDEFNNVTRDSIYIEPISADKAYVVLADESIGTRIGIVGKMELNPSDNSLRIYYPNGALFDVVYFVGKGELTVASHGGSFYYKDKSAHTPQYWNHIGNKFAESNEWYE